MDGCHVHCSAGAAASARAGPALERGGALFRRGYNLRLSGATRISQRRHWGTGDHTRAAGVALCQFGVL